MKVRKVHEVRTFLILHPLSEVLMFEQGQFLLCRVITEPCTLSCSTMRQLIWVLSARTFAVELIVEDRKGDAVFVSIYNYPKLFLPSKDILEAHFSIGDISAIKEPWVKMPAAGYGNPIIRVDSPSDVIFLARDSSQVQRSLWSNPPSITAEECRVRGIALFKKGFYIPAARVWSKGLRVDPTVPALYLNRSQAYVKLGWYTRALDDANSALAIQTYRRP